MPRGLAEPNHLGLVVGTFLGAGQAGGGAPRLSTTSVECPYCHDPLGQLPDGRRYARVDAVVGPLIGGRVEVELTEIPETYRVLRCGPCDAMFVAER